jgi:hypothetical protein
MFIQSSSVLPATGQAGQKVPPEYQELYSTLKESLDSFNVDLTTLASSGGAPIFGAELLPANSNRGDALLASNVMQSVSLCLDRFRELGIGGVTFPVGYPLYTPGFPYYQSYVRFYKRVVQEVRRRGMIVEIESSVMFANSPFSSIRFDYSKLTFQQFQTQRKQMISAIIQDLHPDYLNLGSEPDTQYKLTGYQEFRSPTSYTTYINHILDGLDRGSTKLGAGSGTWNGPEYVQSLAANTSLDFIALHVYPVIGPCLQRILTFSEIAKQHEKSVAMDEAWLYKSDTLQSISIAANIDVFRNDVFSFWSPLDQEFLSTMNKAARIAGIEYVSAFWSTLFFSYLDYSQSNAILPYKDLTAALNKAASQNMQNRRFSSTGLFYGQLTGTLSPESTAIQTGETTASLPSRRSGIFLIFVGLALAGGLVVVIILIRRLKASQRETLVS